MSALDASTDRVDGPHGTNGAPTDGHRPTVYGVSSMVAPLRRVAVRRPTALLSADHERWHYRRPIEPDRVLDEHAQLVAAMAAAGVEVEWMDDDPDELADSVFTFDPTFMLPTGALLLRPGKALREPEVHVHERYYRQAGIPIVGRIEAPGTVEGGDLMWMDERTLAVALGTRTDEAGWEQLRDLVAPLGIEARPYVLPALEDPEACLHLLSVVNPLDVDLALVHRPLLPERLAEDLTSMGYELLDVPANEFEASFGLNLNVLPVAPRQCLAIAGFPATHALVRDAGCDVVTFDGEALCVNCEGGPTCLTRPILRR